MAQRFKLIGITILSILVLTIVGAVSLSPAYAQTMTLNISPNHALPGQSVTFSGQVTPPATSTDQIEIDVFSPASSCSATDIRFVWLAVNLAPSLTPLANPSIFTGTADNVGHYSITVPGGFPAGQYAAVAYDGTSPYSFGVFADCDPFTVSTVIPEYPFGLAVLAAFMVIAYGVIRRKTIVKQK
jgi:hypothetical protein